MAQLDVWRGDFGFAYTNRNVVDPTVRLPAFRTMLAGAHVKSVLEVGCNRGHNLATLAEVLGPDAGIAGLEPNDYARGFAAETAPGATLVYGHADALPFADESFDLVLTCGVLIHVPPALYETSLREIHRVARRYVLAVEYFAEAETAISYREQEDLLWKRDFGGDYRRLFPELQERAGGTWMLADGFDRTRWWLLEKPGARA